MAKQVLAELILRMQDQLSGQAAKAAESLRKVEQAANAIGNNAGANKAKLDTLSAALDRTAAAAQKFAGVSQNEGWGRGFTSALTKLKLTEQELERLRAAWKKLQAELATNPLSASPGWKTTQIRAWRDSAIRDVVAVRSAMEQLERRTVAETAKAAAERARITKQELRERQQDAATAARALIGYERDIERAKTQAARETAREQARIAREQVVQARQAAREQATIARQSAREAAQAAREHARAVRQAQTEASMTAGGFRREMGYLVGVPAATYGAGRLARQTLTAGTREESQRAQDYLAGLSDEESARMGNVAARQSNAFRSLRAADLHSVMREGSINLGGRAGGGFDMMEQLSPDAAAAMVVMQSRFGREQAMTNMRQFMRSMDVMGRNTSSDRMRTILEGFTRVAGVEGNEFNFRDLFLASKYMSSAGQSLSDRELFTFLPTMMGDVGGQRAGTQLASTFSALLGGRMTDTARGNLQEFGLHDEGTNRVRGADTLRTSIQEWTEKFLMPALQRGGVNLDDNGAVVEAASRLFSNRLVGDMFARAISQRAQISNRQQQYDLAPAGPAAANRLAELDPNVSYEQTRAQFDNTLAQVAKPLLEIGTPILRSVAEMLSGVAQNMRENPNMGTGVLAALGIGGGLGVAGLLRGLLSLGTAGPALMGAAAALTGAATALGGGSAAGAAAGAAGAAGSAGLMSRFMPLLRGLGLVGGIAALGYGASQITTGIGTSLSGGYIQRDSDSDLQERLADAQSRLGAVPRANPLLGDTDVFSAQRQNIEIEIAQIQGEIQRRLAQAGQEGGAAAGQGIVTGLQNSLTGVQNVISTIGASIRALGAVGGAAPVAPAAPSDGAAAPRASGGPTFAGQAYLIGENGPEVLTMGGDGYIHPISGGGSGGGLSVALGGIHIHGANRDQIVGKVMSEIEGRLRESLRAALNDGEMAYS